MAYKRQIAYFDYMEYGEKKGNGGFCKWQQKNGLHTLEISISGLKENNSEKVKIFTKTGGELGDLQLHNGHGHILFTKKELEGNWNWEFSQIRVLLTENMVLVAEFPIQEMTREAVKQVEERKTLEPIVEMVGEKEPESITEEKVQESVEKVEEKPMIQKIESLVKELAVKKEPKPITESEEERTSVVSRSEEENKSAVKQKEEWLPVSLWEWLEQTHEKMHPFGTQEEYFRIAVEDIYRLNEECHVLRNNQFLLHGYYNYKYLILGKKGGSSEEYWLGVPGIYHEREKMAARMYGFEKFEGTKQNYTVGDLGYYLITAQ